MVTPIIFGKRTRSKIAARKLQMRTKLWPDLDPKRLWDRKEKVGFVTIPRALPLVMGIMDDMTNGRPVSRVYLDFWCRAYDDSFVIITKPKEHAFASGFTGQRAEGAWATRVRLLQKLGFIDVKPGSSGQLNYVLIWNPFEVLKQHRAAHTAGLREDTWNALQQRLIEVGADDLDEVVVAVEAAPASA